AIATDDQGKAAFLQNVMHSVRKEEREGADRAAVTDRGAGLRPEEVRRTPERKHLACVYRRCQAGRHQHLWSTPSTWLMSGPRWPQAQIAGCENEPEGPLFPGKQLVAGASAAKAASGASRLGAVSLS